MKKILLLLLTVVLVAGCSLETGKVNPDKEKFTIDLNNENENQ